MLFAPESATNICTAIFKSIQSLDTFPFRYSIIQTEPERTLGIRKMVVGNYLICYFVDNQSAIIIGILHAACDFHKNCLKELRFNSINRCSFCRYGLRNIFILLHCLLFAEK